MNDNTWPWQLDTDRDCDWHVLRGSKYGYVSDACVEGTTEEWRAIAEALRKGESVRFRRCAVHWLDAVTFLLCSPRNTLGNAARLSGHAKANELADIIDRALDAPGDAP